MLGKTNVKVKPNKRISIDYVDYIESTGTQYIDTGYIPNDNITVEIRTSTKLNSNNSRSLFGSRNSTSSLTNRFALFFGDYNTRVYYDFQYGAVNHNGYADSYISHL